MFSSFFIFFIYLLLPYPQHVECPGMYKKWIHQFLKSLERKLNLFVDADGEIKEVDFCAKLLCIPLTFALIVQIFLEFYPTAWIGWIIKSKYQKYCRSVYYNGCQFKIIDLVFLHFRVCHITRSKIKASHWLKQLQTHSTVDITHA